MVDDGPYLDSLQWAIDRQKSDYQAIRKQLRRYFVIVITVVFVRGYALVSGDSGFLGIDESTTLEQQGILWQTNALPAEMAPHVTDAILQLSAIFFAIGGVLILKLLDTIVISERMKGCYPRDDAQKIVGENLIQFEEWIEQNDDILNITIELKEDIIRIGRHGVIIFVISYVLQVTARLILVVPIILIIYISFYCHNIFQNDRSLKDADYRYVFYLFLPLFVFTQPLMIYQETYGYIHPAYAIIPIVLAFAITAYWFRSQITSLLQHYLPEAVQSSLGLSIRHFFE